jgi:hypothetical protein
VANSIIIALGLSACGTTEKVNFETQALIQVQNGDIIFEIDGKEVYSAFSPREQAVTPGWRVVLVTRFGDIRFDRGVYRLNVLAGLTYQIAKNRRSVKVSNSTGAIVDELFLSLDDGKTFVSRADYQLEQKARQDQLKREAAVQDLLSEAYQQTKRRNLPLIRKIGAQICKNETVQVGYTPIDVVYVGYVEGITDDKVQIRVSRAYFKSNPSVSPGGFSPSIIWDDPMNWDLCR